ncbi:MAG TPA: glycosyltransferase, partial [Polyangia bacterium]
MGNATTWALTVATYKRHQILAECVKRALRQTVGPAEIVIVDASPNWQEGKVAIEALCREAGVPCQYVEASVPSSAVQRNQGIALARADVLFMIDD